MRKIAIVGARPPAPGGSEADRALFQRILVDVRAFCAALAEDEAWVIVSGGAEGVDACAMEAFGHAIVHVPDYTRFGPRKAPLERNTLIVRDCDLLHAWPAPWSRGTWDTVRKAKDAGKPTTIHTVT